MSPERRRFLRLEILAPVKVDSAIHGEVRCVARNISEGGICLETQEPLPLGSEVSVYFGADEGTVMMATGRVRNHYFLNYGPDTAPGSFVGMGVRFSAFHDAEGRAATH